MVGHQYPRRRRQDRTRFPSYSSLASYFSLLLYSFLFWGLLRKKIFYLFQVYDFPCVLTCIIDEVNWRLLPGRDQRVVVHVLKRFFLVFLLLLAGNYLNSKSRLFSLFLLGFLRTNMEGDPSIWKKEWSSKKKVGKRSIGFVYYSFVSSLYTQTERETPFSDITACLVSVCCVCVCVPGESSSTCDFSRVIVPYLFASATP